MFSLARSLGAMAFGLFAAFPASAQYFSADEVVQISMLPGYRIDGDRHMAAIRIDLAPGWKTYWRSPGEGGVPTILSLTEAEGVSGMAIHWPAPQVFISNGLRSVGYDGSVILPVEFVLSTNGTAQIAGRLDLGVCQDVCMPISVDLGVLLAPETGRDGAIVAALSDRPLTAGEAGAGSVTCAVEPISDGLRVTLRAQVPNAGRDETVVLEHRDPMIWVSEAMSERQATGWLPWPMWFPPIMGPLL